MKYVCTYCGYVYDDAAQNIPFSELPDNWKCPVCGAPKSAFKPDAKGTQNSKRVGKSRTK